MIILDSIQSILPIVIMIAVGYFLTRRGWFGEDAAGLFSKVVTNVALPPYMIYNVMSTYTRAQLIEAGPGLIVPFLSMGAAYVIGVAVAAVCKVKRGRRGAFQSMFSLSNTIFVGLPICLALFGDKSAPYVLLYYIANTTLFWTIGVYGISCDGRDESASVFSLTALKRIFSPPLIGFIIAVFLVMCGIQLPAFLMNTCKYLGNLTTPMAMLFIGMVMAESSSVGIKIDRDLLLLNIGRFLVTPLITLVMANYFSIPLLMKQVFVVMAAMPAMGQTPIMCRAYDADYQYAAAAVTLTTIISMIVIPVYMMFMN